MPSDSPKVTATEAGTTATGCGRRRECRSRRRRRTLGTGIVQGYLFLSGLLHPIFSKISQAQLECLLNTLNRHGFGHADEGHGRGMSAAALAGLLHALANALKVIAQHAGYSNTAMGTGQLLRETCRLMRNGECGIHPPKINDGRILHSDFRI